jgi:hypothetical protein
MESGTNHHDGLTVSLSALKTPRRTALPKNRANRFTTDGLLTSVVRGGVTFVVCTLDAVALVPIAAVIG